MSQTEKRTILSYLGAVLGTIGGILLAGSVFVWKIGMDALTTFYENNTLVVCGALAGISLLVLGIFISSLATGTPSGGANSEMDPAPGTAPEANTRCGKCEAINGLHAKFCDQCGVVLPGR